MSKNTESQNTETTNVLQTNSDNSIEWELDNDTYEENNIDHTYIEHSEYYGNIIGSYGKKDGEFERIRTITIQLNHGTDEENEANAQHIVKCVNERDELVEA